MPSRMRCEQPRPLQDLLGERARRGVVGAQQREARARVAGRDAGQELEVVLQDHRVDRLRGDVDHARAGVAQADEQEEQPLLVEARRRAACAAPPGPGSARAPPPRCAAPPPGHQDVSHTSCRRGFSPRTRAISSSSVRSAGEGRLAGSRRRPSRRLATAERASRGRRVGDLVLVQVDGEAQRLRAPAHLRGRGGSAAGPAACSRR